MYYSGGDEMNLTMRQVRQLVLAGNLEKREFGGPLSRIELTSSASPVPTVPIDAGSGRSGWMDPGLLLSKAVLSRIIIPLITISSGRWTSSEFTDISMRRN
jgi:hypothetical protein